LNSEIDVSSYAKLLLDAYHGKHWILLLALVLGVVVATARWVAPKVHGKLGTFLNSDRGAAILVLVGGLAGSVVTSAMGGKISLDTLVNGVVTSLTAAGGYTLLKRIISPSDKPPALLDSAETLAKK